MYRRWHHDLRRTSGGYWRNTCSVNERARQRDLYDTDHVWRIGKNLRNDARRRRQTIDMRKAMMTSGKVS